MKLTTSKLVIVLWTAVAVLIAGIVAVALLLTGHIKDVEQTNSELNGNVDSLRRQLEQIKAAPTPTPTPEATATPTPTASPSPSPSVSPSPTATPKSQPN